MLDFEPAGGVPPPARLAAKAVLPKRGWTYDVGIRGAGVGSRGHRRFVLVGDCDGAPAARELKELAPAASQWLGRPPTRVRRSGRDRPLAGPDAGRPPRLGGAPAGTGLREAQARPWDDATAARVDGGRDGERPTSASVGAIADVRA